jgi:hypothetical protein
MILYNSQHREIQAKQVCSCSMSRQDKSENINTKIVFINIHSTKKRSEESSEMHVV